jgi:hypothetical protein
LVFGFFAAGDCTRHACRRQHGVAEAAPRGEVRSAAPREPVRGAEISSHECCNSVTQKLYSRDFNEIGGRPKLGRREFFPDAAAR